MDDLKDRLSLLFDEELIQFLDEFAMDGYALLDLSQHKADILHISRSFLRSVSMDREGAEEFIHELLKSHYNQDKFQTLIQRSIKSGKGTMIKLQSNLKLVDQHSSKYILSINLKEDYPQYLEEKLNHYRNILKGTGLTTWEWDLKSNKTRLTEFFGGISGKEYSEMQELDASEYQKMVHPEDREKGNAIFEDYLKNELDYFETEQRVKHTDGHWIWVYTRGKVSEYDENGNPLKVSGIFQDVTEKKKQENLMLKYKNLLERTNEVAKIGTWEVDLESMKVNWSKNTTEIHEVKEHQHEVADAINFYKEGYSRETIQRVFDNCANKGVNFDEELQIVTGTGKEKWVRAVGIPVVENGKTISVYGLFQDIDEKTRLVNSLAEREEQFRVMFEYSGIGMALEDSDGNLIKVNEKLAAILGYSQEDLLQMGSLLKITPEADHHQEIVRRNEIREKKRSGFRVYKKYVHKNGKDVYAQLTVNSTGTVHGKGQYLITQIIDITKEQEAIKLQEETLSELIAILNAASNAIILETERDGNIKRVNQGMASLTGYSREELLTMNVQDLFGLISNGIHSKEDQNESTFINTLLHFAKQAEKRETKPSEFLVKRKDGKEFTAQLSLVGLKDKDSNVKGYLAIGIDITDIKEAEKEIKTLLNVTQAQNKRLMNFAHIVSHNLRSHSGNIKMILDLIKLENTESISDEYYKLLNEASDNLLETIDHLNQVVSVGISEDEKPEEILLSELLDKTVANIKALCIKENCTIHNNIEEDIKVNAIPAYLESVFLNLLTNAIKYKSPSRPPIIKVQAKRYLDQIMLIFEDNGLGIDLEKHGDKLFGMYKTFHGNKDARGIGLFMTKNQIEAMGGKIEVESHLDKGTVFKIYLPYGEIAYRNDSR